MSIGNPALGDVLAQHGGPHRLLAALAEGGLLVAVRPDRSVVLGTTQAGDRVLLGYTSAGTYARHGGSHSLSDCDADTILDIQRVTGVREIVIDAAGPTAAAVPIEDLLRYLRSTRPGPAPALSGTTPTAYATGAMATVSRASAVSSAGSAGPVGSAAPLAPAGPMSPLASPTPPLSPSPPAPPSRPLPPARPMTTPVPAASAQPWIPAPRPHLSGPMQMVDPGYKRCAHPILPALRVAIAQLLADFPLIHHVWISEARTASGAPGIMLHVKVHMSAAEDVVRDLHRMVRARLPQLAASDAPILMARVADARSEQRMIEVGAHVVCADVRD
ncbi:hypothetical protein HS048_32185 [Planomonospora sp. ID91781]|uniref:Uncharacterized protein n=3 Tax=Planomonospora TaxID=1998 RepID=A0A171D236_9ACTN|nr:MULTISPECIES: hypothetical protein [Planomonospora]MBG0825349.1 hypothetical protein [Planomonospora sp. ID91781]GAT67548.1 hypothetical protein PS9374_03206 [Planomonospora sphaerica]GGK50916.1 hypothetical protein GCM10010126_08010 [Planomonospora parontospora]GII07062.1 hypothetical protein Ppa06_08600 [Planomonospora parontospora subsp. parontospora]